jgi:hypothetical protein
MLKHDKMSNGGVRDAPITPRPTKGPAPSVPCPEEPLPPGEYYSRCEPVVKFTDNGDGTITAPRDRFHLMITTLRDLRAKTGS